MQEVKSWKESSEEKERELLTFEYKCSCRQQSDRDEKLSECASEISRFLRTSRLGSRVGRKSRLGSQDLFGSSVAGIIPSVGGAVQADPPSVELLQLWCVCLPVRQLPHEQQDL